MNKTSLPSVEEVVKEVANIQPEDVYTPDWESMLTQDRNQAYTSLVEGIKAQVKDINGENSVFDDFATDIIENVVKPLYGKK